MYTLLTPPIGLKTLKLTFPLLPHPHKTSHIPTPITIIRCRPNRHTSILKPPLMPRLHQLMRPYHPTQPIMLQKINRRPTTEYPTHSTTAQHPSIDLVRIGPHQISKTTRCWYLTYPINIIYIVDCVNIGR